VDSAADRAAWGIRALIVSGSYRAGDRLPAERELASDLKLSRPALREGIRRLRSGGVLESRRGSGTYVSQVDIGGLFELRERVEPLAAERAAKLRNESELTDLKDSIEAMHRSLEDPADYDVADLRFHAFVAQASKSPVLVSTLDMLTELGLLVRAATSTSKQLRINALNDVERIYSAIERGHPKRAANAMERHILAIRASLNGRIDGYGRLDGRRRS
jgi:DNA-binding FadR family transcriptional regulator